MLLGLHLFVLQLSSAIATDCSPAGSGSLLQTRTFPKALESDGLQQEDFVEIPPAFEALISAMSPGGAPKHLMVEHNLTRQEAVTFLNENLIKEPPLPRELTFVHIPKNAGQQIELAGWEDGMMWGFNAVIHDHYFNKVKFDEMDSCTWHHVPPSYLPGLKVYSQSPTFCVTRHPYSRAVSEYKWLLFLGTSMSQYDYPLVHQTDDDCSPEALNVFWETMMATMDTGRKYLMDCHLIPQAKYIYDDTGGRTCDNVLKLEEFPTSFNELMTKHNVSVQLEQENKFNSHDFICPNLTVSNLSPNTKELLHLFYFEDFDLLGYSPM